MEAEGNKVGVSNQIEGERLSGATAKTEKSARPSNASKGKKYSANSGLPDDVDVLSITTEGHDSSGEGEDADDEDEDNQNFVNSPRSSEEPNQERKSNVSDEVALPGPLDPAGRVHFQGEVLTQGAGRTSLTIENNAVKDGSTEQSQRQTDTAGYNEHDIVPFEPHHHYHHHHHHQHFLDSDSAIMTTHGNQRAGSAFMKKVWKPPTLDEGTQAGISSWDWLSRLEQLLIHFFLTIFETKNDDSKLIMELMPAEAGVQVEEIFQLLLKAEPEMYKDLGSLINLAENWLIYWKGESEQREKAMNFVRVYLKKVKSRNYYKLPIQVRLHKLGAFIAGLKDVGKEGDHGPTKYPVYKQLPPINNNLRLISPRVKPATHFSRVVANILCGRPCTSPLPFASVYADKLGVNSFRNTLHGDKEFRAYTDLKYGRLFHKRDIFLREEFSSDIHLELDAGGDASSPQQCIKNTNCWLPLYNKLYMDGLKETAGQCAHVAKMELDSRSRHSLVSGTKTFKNDQNKLYEWVRGPDKKVHQKLVGTYTQVGATSSVDSISKQQAGKNRSRSPKTIPSASKHKGNKKPGAQSAKAGRGPTHSKSAGQTKAISGSKSRHGQLNKVTRKGDKGKQHGALGTKSKQKLNSYKVDDASPDGSEDSGAGDTKKRKKKVSKKVPSSNRLGKNKSNERSREGMKKVGPQGSKLDRSREDQRSYGRAREDQRNHGQGGRAREEDQRNSGPGGRAREDQRNYGQGGRAREEDQRNYGQGGRAREDQRNYGQGGRAREEDQRNYGPGGRAREDQRNYGPGGKAREEDQRNYGPGGRAREDQRNYGPGGRAREEDQRNYGQGGRAREDQRNYGPGGRAREEDQRNYGPGGRAREDQRNYGPRGRALEDDQRNHGPRGRALEDDQRNYGQGDKAREEDRRSYGDRAREEDRRSNNGQGGKTREEDQRSYGQGGKAREDDQRSQGGATRNSIHATTNKVGTNYSARTGGSQTMPHQINKTAPQDPRAIRGPQSKNVQWNRNIRDVASRRGFQVKRHVKNGHRQNWAGEGFGGEDTDGETDVDAQDTDFLTEEQQNMMIVNRCWEKASKVLKRPGKGLVLPPPENLMLYLEHKFPGYKWGKGEPIALRNFPNGTVFVAQYANGGSRVYYPHGGLAVAISGPSPSTSQILVVRDPSDHVFFFDKALLASLNSSGKGIVYGDDGVISAEYSTIGGFRFDNGLEKGCRWLWNQGGQRLIMKLNKFMSIRMSDFDKVFLNFYGNRRGFLVNVATGLDVTVMSLDKPMDPAMMELSNLIRPKSMEDPFDYLRGRFTQPPTIGFVDKQKNWNNYDNDDDEENGGERKYPNTFLTNQRKYEFERLKKSYKDRLTESFSHSSDNI